MLCRISGEGESWKGCCRNRRKDMSQNRSFSNKKTDFKYRGKPTMKGLQKGLDRERVSGGGDEKRVAS